MAKKKDETPSGTGGPTDRKTLNVMLGMGMLNQFDQTQREFSGQGGQVQSKREYLPKPLRFVSTLGGVLLAVGCLGLILYFLTFLLSGHHGVGLPAAGWGLGLGIPLYGGMRGLEAYLERRDWLRRNVSRDGAPTSGSVVNSQPSSKKKGESE